MPYIRVQPDAHCLIYFSAAQTLHARNMAAGEQLHGPPYADEVDIRGRHGYNLVSGICHCNVLLSHDLSRQNVQEI